MTGAREFFERACDAFEASSRLVERTDRVFRVADEVVEFQLAGRETADYVSRAFEHLTAPPNEPPALSIAVWRGGEMPRPPWRWEAGLGRGEIPGFSSERLRVAYHLVPGVLCMLDLERSRGVYWIRDDRMPFHDCASLLRTLLHWWLAERDRQLAHAAAVGTRQGGVLLVGPSGSGKSTLALACLSAGLGYVSDDVCIVGDNGGPYAWSIFSTAKLDQQAWQRFPELAQRLCNSERLELEKGLLFLCDAHKSQVLEGFPVRALVVPRVAKSSTCRVRPTSPGVGLAALAPSTIAQLPLAGARAFRVLSSLVAKVPCYELELGRDLGEASSIISRILS